ncbi:3-oxoacyl-ACP reductase [Clostridia bacterium]|nr:3-oxoacyl-ACP reductase [Clostridia bacterium]
MVTGAAGGIGRATSNALAQLGAEVALVDIPAKETELAALAEKIHDKWGVSCCYFTGDISSESSVENIFNQAYEKLGPVTILHNNAGIGIWPDDSSLPTESWQKMVDVNLTGSFFMARCCAVRMKEAGLKGSIITTASMSSHIINAGPGYSATKAGVRHMSASFGIEFAKDNIRFNTVSYGYILSGMHKVAGGEEELEELYQIFERNTPMGRMGSLEDVVGAVVYLASDLSAFQTASDILVDGGFSIGRL